MLSRRNCLLHKTRVQCQGIEYRPSRNKTRSYVVIMIYSLGLSQIDMCETCFHTHISVHLIHHSVAASQLVSVRFTCIDRFSLLRALLPVTTLNSNFRIRYLYFDFFNISACRYALFKLAARSRSRGVR